MSNLCEATEVHVQTTVLTELVDLPALVAHFKVSRNTILRWVDRGEFPAPIRTGRRLLRWRVDDVNRWIESQPETTKAE